MGVPGRSPVCDWQGNTTSSAEAAMPYGLYISAEGAQAQSTRLDVIANNLANVDTVGFKRELAVCQARYAEAITEGLKMPDSGGIDDVGGGVMVRQTVTEFSPGPLQQTNNRTDVAIKGNGFFLVRNGEETFLTRAGNFRVATDGRLTTQQGYEVLDQDGVSIAVNPADPTWAITSEGAVRGRGTSQNLALVRPVSPGDLVRVGENLFRPLTQPQPVPSTARAVVPGCLEKSAVRPTSEMTEMIQASRALEANVNMMKTQDEMLGGLINRLMRVR
ncbi:MAG: flagellar basal-body rod protein FlgF [Planctomycetes bacterium RBG_13_63_9]|nr:MAG: flagellar basal-body rod protein FlgF [Planctomycetes bacterium RBG_13_63_9]